MPSPPASRLRKDRRSPRRTQRERRRVRTGAPSAASAAGLAAENAMLRHAIEQLPNGLSMFDGQDRLLLANRRYTALWGLPPALGQPGTRFADIIAATRGREAPARALAQPLTQPLTQPFTEPLTLPLAPSSAPKAAGPSPAAAGPGQPRTRRREWTMDDGRTVEVVVTTLPDGTAIALHEDITEQRAAEAQIAYLARHDALTGLPNRSAMQEDLERLLMRNARGEPLAVLCLDLDRFKAINDLYGHPAGDRLLWLVAERLRSCARETDLLVRLGGDEFAVLQCGAPQPDSATALAQRLIDALAEPFDIDGQMAQIGTSVGIAVAPADGADAETLFMNADLALYRAKAEGRGTLRCFAPEMDLQARARRALEADLHHALARGELSLAYQPQVDLAGSMVSGVEALLRWHHATRGAVSPAEFIPMAEDSGLIVPLGRWVLATACRDAAQWPEDVRVAVNVSAVQFKQGNLLQDVQDALAASGLPPQRLEIEITESVLMSGAPQVLALLGALRGLGVRVAMDDFGTGFSSLSYLRSFSFDRIKIDRSFVHNVEHDADARAIIRAVTGLGRSLGMQTTVEGVETLAQLHAARTEGSDEVQGYLFSWPRPAADIPALLQTVGSAARDASAAGAPGSR